MNNDNENIDNCPGCGAKIDPDLDHCPVCKLELSVKDFLEPDMTKESKDLISLFKLNDLMEAQVLRTILEDADIPCVVSEGGMTSYMGVSTPSGISFTRIKLLVPASRARDAVAALAEHKQWTEDELARYLSMLDELK